jgi:hypothetical protein
VRRFVLLVLALVLAGAAMSGCGWLRAGNVSHTKPSGFVLRGYVTVAVPTAGQVGSSCQAPTSAVVADDTVRVADPPDRSLATGTLGQGVLARDGGAYRCNFPFEIPAVPGGHTSYEITAGGLAPVSFPAAELRQDKPAVITVP